MTQSTYEYSSELSIFSEQIPRSPVFQANSFFSESAESEILFVLLTGKLSFSKEASDRQTQGNLARKFKHFHRKISLQT